MVPQRVPAMPSWGPPDGPEWCSHQWWEEHFANFSELSILLRQDLDFNKMLLLPSVGATFCEFLVDRNPV